MCKSGRQCAPTERPKSRQQQPAANGKVNYSSPAPPASRGCAYHHADRLDEIPHRVDEGCAHVDVAALPAAAVRVPVVVTTTVRVSVVRTTARVQDLHCAPR